MSSTPASNAWATSPAACIATRPISSGGEIASPLWTPLRATTAPTLASSVSHSPRSTCVRRTPSAMEWWNRVIIADPTVPSSRVMGEIR